MPVVACLARQAYEEANHARTYTTMAENICEDTDRIYDLANTEPALIRKNKAVARMYEMVNTRYDANDFVNKVIEIAVRIDGKYYIDVEALESLRTMDEISDDDLLKAFAANQILEQLVFPGGFIVLWSFNFKGTNKAIQFIERDESGTHVPLFKNIFASTRRQLSISDETVAEILAMIKDMAEEEKIWTKHISKNLLGFSDKAIDMFIENKANSVCTNLKIDTIYEITDGGPLQVMFDEHSLLSETSTKTNFFETAASDYSVNSIDDDF